MKKQLKKLMNNLISGLQTGLGLFLLLCTTSISAQYNYDNQYYGEQDDNRYSKNASGLAGDNFSLEGALELFRQSSSPEAFEKALNDERNNVNNLDLDNNGYIDYLRVIDRMQGAVHAVVIQALLGRNDVQDIAVIEIEKKNIFKLLVTRIFMARMLLSNLGDLSMMIIGTVIKTNIVM